MVKGESEVFRVGKKVKVLEGCGILAILLSTLVGKKQKS